jgi:choline dehydrogenase-like flavoprotein
MDEQSVTVADYIIIGGGTSGLVVANRLTEDPDIHVLVLEAGQDTSQDPRVNIPAFWTSLLGSELDWKFVSLPQVSAQANATPHLEADTGLIFLVIAKSGRPHGKGATREGLRWDIFN